VVVPRVLPVTPSIYILSVKDIICYIFVVVSLFLPNFSSEALEPKQNVLPLVILFTLRSEHEKERFGQAALAKRWERKQTKFFQESSMSVGGSHTVLTKSQTSGFEKCCL
jgi:hypothetical protein